MWVNSKQAAEFLRVKYETIKKTTQRAEKAGKKFCTINGQNCLFSRINGNVGGAAGKTLQIWIDDDLINSKNSEISRAGKASRVNWENDARARLLNFTNGESDGDTKLDARDSVDIRGGNGGVFGAGFANTGDRRDQKQTQISQNERMNDGDIPRATSTDVYDTCAGSETNRSPLPLWQINERGEAKAYSDAYAGDGLHQCESNPVHELRFQAGSESQRGANGIAVKDEAIECEVVEQGGLNLSASSAANLPAIATCSDKKRKAAFEKYDVIRAWEDAKGKIGEAAFLEYINARKICCVKVTANKLYDWQRKYKRGGLDALVDERDNNKTLKLEELGLAQLCVELILACKGMGKVDITNIYRSLNYHAIKNSLINFEDFQGKKDEVVSYEVVNRFVNNFLNKNKLVKNIILYGEDGAVGRGLPALGISNYAVNTINEVVEIDGSPLDLICNASDLCDLIGWQNVSAIFKDKDEFESYVKEWQKRYTIIALIDTYSGVATFHISETENSLAIARAVAKYIVRYGKPKVIKGDNGKAFKSEYMREVLGALEIEYKAVRAYSGWLKPYVERNFRALQHSFSANLAGFIGHNISQRQAIEFFRSKKERRLKRGYKTNLTMLKNLNEVQELMDMYAEKFLNTRYLERLGTTCAAAYSQKVDDAVYMNALSISARLSKRELKHVHKKGVSVDNVWYYNLDMFAHERVFVNQNVNNINECFVWSENNEFIGVASTLDLELGVSAEEARTTQKLFNKRLKETKKQMDEALTAHQAGFEQTVRLVEAKPAALPKPQPANNEAAIIDAALKEAKNLNSNAPLEGEILSAAGSDVSPKRAKKIKGWMEIGCAES
jgi:hypothetical protein|nr:MAG TPA: transposase [Caudoviricetes sp.]